MVITQLLGGRGLSLHSIACLGVRARDQPDRHGFYLLLQGRSGEFNLLPEYNELVYGNIEIKMVLLHYSN